MPVLPYPLIDTDQEAFQKSITDMFRDLYENRVGGAELGDVFSIAGDVLQLNIDDTTGLYKANGRLCLDLTVVNQGGLISTAAYTGKGVILSGQAANTIYANAPGSNGQVVSYDDTRTGGLAPLTIPASYTDEMAQDAVGAAFTAGTQTGISVTYNDGANSLSLDAQTAGDARYQKTSEKNASGGYAGLTGTRITKGADVTDDLVVDSATKGLVLKDTQATPHYWRVTVDNSGSLVTSDLGTSKP